MHWKTRLTRLSECGSVFHDGSAFQAPLVTEEDAASEPLENVQTRREERKDS